MPSGGYRSRGSEKGASIAMSAPTATFVVTLTMLTMTLAKLQDRANGRRGLAQPRRQVVAMLEGVDGRRGPVGTKGVVYTPVARQWCAGWRTARRTR